MALNGMHITAPWGTVVFEKDVYGRRHERMVDAVWKNILNMNVSTADRTKDCGRSITPGAMTSIPPELSKRYREDITAQMGPEAKWHVPEHDNFEVYICSA